MSDQLFSPKNLQRFRAIVEDGTPLARNTVLRLIEFAHQNPAPEVTVEELLETRAGLALANGAFHEGVGAGVTACADSASGELFVKPVSPYAASLFAMVKAQEPKQ